jgi:thioesterase domain-containing protein
MENQTTQPAALAALAEQFAFMPPVQALKPKIIAWQDGVLRLHAPLEDNINDKGCAFGGSLVSLMTIAAWGLVALELETAGLQADIFIADSQIRYLKPVFEDIVVDATFDEASVRASLAQTLATQGRAKIHLTARTLLADGSEAAVFTGRYVAMTKA